VSRIGPKLLLDCVRGKGMDAKVTDRNSSKYKLKHSESGKGFMGGGKKWSGDALKTAGKLFGESPNLRKKNGS
jgi:hypothetical protein